MQKPMLKWAVLGVVAFSVMCMLIAMGMYAGMQVVTRALRTTEVAIATPSEAAALPPTASNSPTPEARANAVAANPGRIVVLADDGNIVTLRADGERSSCPNRGCLGRPHLSPAYLVAVRRARCVG